MKKYILSLMTLFVGCLVVSAKENKESVVASKPMTSYKTTVYTDKSLAEEIAEVENQSRGFGDGLVASLGNAAIGVTTGYISSIVDFGIQAIGQLVMLDRKHKQEWQEIVAKESQVKDSIGTLYAINDFYASSSEKGALDPTGIQFNGIGCLATVGQDTAFYVSCHINRQKLHRLVNHSKFELLLDTIIINPYHSHLPQSTLPLSFSFAERKSFNFKMTIRILSSWIDFTPTLHKDEALGEFVLNVPIDSTNINEKGSFVYIRKKGEPAKYDLIGDSFIVPRSYMQISDSRDNTLHDHYGTGQYSLGITIEESCEITPEFQKNWRKDRQKRKKLSKAMRKKQTFDDVCRTVTHQTWDESLQSWVITILKAPLNYSINAMNEQMLIKQTKSASTPLQQMQNPSLNK